MKSEQQLIKIIAKIAPWLAPIPSAYFVARASVRHLAVIRPIDVVIALIIETLGVSSVHTFLWLFGWNESGTTDKGNPRQGVILAPMLETWGAMIISSLYLVITVSLTVILEVYPALSVYAPALFPFLSIVGAVNLVLIARQENRERLLAEFKESKQATKKETPTKTKEPLLKTSIFDNGRKATKEAKKAVLVALYQNNSKLKTFEAAKQLGVSDQTIRNYTKELLAENIIERDGERIVIK